MAFNENSARIHYFPRRKSKNLENNTLVLIDMWARVNETKAPFADITWICYKGRIPEEINNIFDKAIEIRDTFTLLIENSLEGGNYPTGRELNAHFRDIVRKSYKGEKDYYAGHSLGFYSPHGRWGHFLRNNTKPMENKMGYAIEPSIYLPGKFGIRSEINFITNEKGIEITTPIQRSIIRV